MENTAVVTTLSFVYFRLTLRWHTAWKTMRGGPAVREPSLPTQDARPPSGLPATPTTSTCLWSVNPNDVEQSIGYWRKLPDGDCGFWKNAADHAENQVQGNTRTTSALPVI